MQRFRLSAFYVAGVVVAIGLAIWGISMSRSAAEPGTRALTFAMIKLRNPSLCQTPKPQT